MERNAYTFCEKYYPNLNSIQFHAALSSYNVLDSTMELLPFCGFCLRTCPPNVEFYKHVVGSTVELRQSFQSMLGFDFCLVNFSICKPCWKLMQLVQDFRARCFKANTLVERVGQGLVREDNWFSVKNLATIESIRMVIKDQMQQIERFEVAGNGVGTTDNEPIVEQDADLVSTIDVGEVKIEAEADSNEDANSSEEDSPKDDATGDQSHDIEPTNGALDVRRCNQCTRLFVNSKALRIHLPKCHGKPATRRFSTCHICSAMFKYTYQLKVHLNAHEGKKPYKCNCCKKAFVCPKIRNTHQRKCVINILKCTLCEEELPSNQLLLEHYRRVHPGERKHQCSQCELRFRKKYTLIQHERRHHPECLTEHICAECGKRFAREGDLKVHIKNHQLSKAHECKICQKRVSSIRALQEHDVRFHPEVATDEARRRVAQRQRAMDKMKVLSTKKDSKGGRNGEGVYNI